MPQTKLGQIVHLPKNFWLNQLAQEKIQARRFSEIFVVKLLSLAKEQTFFLFFKRRKSMHGLVLKPILEASYMFFNVDSFRQLSELSGNNVFEVFELPLWAPCTRLLVFFPELNDYNAKAKLLTF